MSRDWNPEQQAAISGDGHLFVSAGAGTGKTAVLVERVLRRIDAGTALDAILVITFTDRAASELRARVRTALELRGDLERARQVDGAWISTIHGFCIRVLRGDPIAAGLDPQFGVSDDTTSRILQSQAFDLALERFLDAADDTGSRRLDLLAAYSRRRLRELLLEAYERLRSAGRDLRLVAHAEPELAPAVRAVREAAPACTRDEAARLVTFLDADPTPVELCDLRRFKVRKAGACADYETARRELEKTARDVAAIDDLAQLNVLLNEFARSYQELKDSRSLVDFNDLELRAVRLLESSPQLAQSYRERFAEVMVDEFQDTNRLQTALIDLIADRRLFLVGDEFQSIYRFRHADVGVYRERRTAAGSDVVSLTRNYRSSGHVLDMVNELFGRAFGDRYTDLDAAGDVEPLGPGRVELLLADKRAFDDEDEHWRAAEVRLVADRIAELVESGECRPGQVVLLFEAGTDAVMYEAALRRRGIRTVRTTGGGYYAQQQVADVLNYLRLLRNRYDDFALVSVLASPLVGVSNDGLLALRRAAVRRPIFSALERDELPEGVSAEDGRLLGAFRQRLARLSSHLGEVGLERLIDQVVAAHDYDLACLAQPDGDRRLANVTKLARVAASYEALRGPDLEGFIGFCDEQAEMASREAEAAIAEEDAQAVVLMTTHAAKGLEFDVVVLVDTGRERLSRQAGDILVDAQGRVALRAPDPADGAMQKVLGWDEVAVAERAAQIEEGRRLQYVALTRARRHLLVSGSLDPGEETTVGQICTTLGVDLEREGDIDVGRARLAVRIARPGAAEQAEPHAPEPQPEVGGQLELFSVGGRSVPLLEPLAAPEPAAPVALQGLSYSALSLYRRCGYRYFAQRILRLPEPERERLVEGLDALELGDAVHLELERPDGRWRALYPAATAENEQLIERLCTNWRDSQLAASLASAASLTRERSFAFEVEGVLFHGRIDIYATESDGTVAGDRLQDQSVGRPVGGGDRRWQLRRAGGHLRARGAAGGSPAGGGGVCLPGEHGRSCRPARSPLPMPPRSRPSWAPISPPSARAAFPPARDSSAASVRRSTCCVRVNAWSGVERRRRAARPRGRDPRPALGRASRRPHRARLPEPARPAGGDDPLGPVHG